jgi:hypothetical protein
MKTEDRYEKGPYTMYVCVCVVQSVVYMKKSVEHCVEQDYYTRRYVWNRTTIHEDMCGTGRLYMKCGAGRLYMKICVEQDDYTRRYVWYRTLCGTGRLYMKICVEQDDYT